MFPEDRNWKIAALHFRVREPELLNKVYSEGAKVLKPSVQVY